MEMEGEEEMLELLKASAKDRDGVKPVGRIRGVGGRAFGSGEGRRFSKREFNREMIFRFGRLDPE